MGINRLLHSAEKIWNLSSSFSGDQVSAIWITSPPTSSDHESLVELASTLYYLSSFNTSYIFSEMLKFSPKISNNKIWKEKGRFWIFNISFFLNENFKTSELFNKNTCWSCQLLRRIPTGSTSKCKHMTLPTRPDRQTSASYCAHEFETEPGNFTVCCSEHKKKSQISSTFSRYNHKTSSSVESVMWHHPIGGEVTGYNPYPLCTGSARWSQEGYGDRDNVIHPNRQRSHQLQVGEIPSIESPVIVQTSVVHVRFRIYLHPVYKSVYNCVRSFHAVYNRQSENGKQICKLHVVWNFTINKWKQKWVQNVSTNDSTHFLFLYFFLNSLCWTGAIFIAIV
jgi:hypothetical protein